MKINKKEIRKQSVKEEKKTLQRVQSHSTNKSFKIETDENKKLLRSTSINSG